MALELVYYVLAAFFEIFGCYSFWMVFKMGKNYLWLISGIISLIFFAWVLTKINSEFAGRAYAAYGGIYIASSLVWLIGIEKMGPTRWDLLGAILSILGAFIIIFGNLKA